MRDGGRSYRFAEEERKVVGRLMCESVKVVVGGRGRKGG